MSPKKSPMDFTLQDFNKVNAKGVRILSKQHLKEMKAVDVYNAQKQWNTSIQRSERTSIQQEKTKESNMVVNANKSSNPATAIPIMFPIKSRTITAMSQVTDTTQEAPTEK